MLSDDQTRLLTAYVDGELSPHERQEALRLLHQSSEARELLRQLQEQVHRLKKLPRRKVTPSLAPDVLRAIAERGLQPAPAPPRRPPRRGASYVAAAAVAATVMIAGASSAYWYFVHPAEENVAKIEVPKPIVPEKKQPISIPDLNPIEDPGPAKKTPPKRRPPNPLIPRLVEGIYAQAAAPIPEARPVVAAFRDLLTDGPAAQRIADALHHDRAVTLDLTVKNSSAAIERLQAALYDQGVKVVLDATVSQQLRKGAGAREYWVYADDLRPDELRRLLRDVGKDDNRQQKFAVSPYRKVTVAPLTDAQRRQVSGRLGLDAAKLAPPPEGPLPTTPIPRWERSAAVLPTSGKPSQEVQTYVRDHRAARPGTMQVLIKIRLEK